MNQQPVFIVDNHDSFTYNLVEALRKLGCKRIKVKKHHQVQVTDIQADTCILFSPGPALPKDHPIMFQLLDAYASTHRILGVCLGHQAIGQWCGADLRQLDTIKHGHKVKVSVRSPDHVLFQNLPIDMEVGLYHSWVVDHNTLPFEKAAQTAMSEEGNLMALHVKGTRVFGVQFHPESYMTEHGLALLENWLRA